MYEVLRSILVEDLHMRADDVAPTAGRTEVGLDSLAVVELSSVLRNRLGIEIPDYELLELATVDDIAALMRERLSSAAGPDEPPV